jgi:hypothetical protein
VLDARQHVGDLVDAAETTKLPVECRRVGHGAHELVIDAAPARAQLASQIGDVRGGADENRATPHAGAPQEVTCHDLVASA